MNRQIQIEIACILSNIFLLSSLHHKDNGKINIEETKAYYKSIANDILNIYPHFSKKDLDSIFPTVAYYCMYQANLWVFYDDWTSFDKQTMKYDLESQWKYNYIFGLFYKHKVKYKYKMLCNVFGFGNDETIWSRDREIPQMIHIPLIVVIGGAISLSLAISWQFGVIMLLCIVIAWILTYTI